MLRALAMVSGLASASVFLVPTAFADCKHNMSHCDEVVVYACGNKLFVGGSDEGHADQIALNKAAAAGYDTDDCKRRGIR
jgi:hypothetical protein